MNYAKATEPLTALKTRSAELIRQSKDSGQPIILTRNGRPAAVLQDVETYQRQRESLTFLKLVLQGERDYQRGAVLTDSEADAHFRARLDELRARG